MSREIEALLDEAADEFASDGAVSLPTTVRLAEAGYILRALRGDIHRILTSRRDI